MFWKGWLALSIAVTMGCSDRIGVRIHAEHEAEALLIDASEILGVWLEPGDGPIVLELVDVAAGEPAGRVLVNRSCLRVIRASYSAAVLAHEVGHVLGLEHVDDPRNVMAVYTDDESRALTLEQRSTIETAAQELSRCR